MRFRFNMLRNGIWFRHGARPQCAHSPSLQRRLSLSLRLFVCVWRAPR